MKARFSSGVVQEYQAICGRLVAVPRLPVEGNAQRLDGEGRRVPPARRQSTETPDNRLARQICSLCDGHPFEHF